jgi:hypothetical protein
MADASEEHVMVQRTDIAGNVRCSMGQVSPGNGGLCRRAPTSVLIAKSYFSEPKLFLRTSARCSLRRQQPLPSLHDGSSSLHAIFLETRPMEH